MTSPIAVLVLLACVSSVLCSWGCPGFVGSPIRIYEDVDFEHLVDTRYQLPHCTVDWLTRQAIKHFDAYRRVLALPDPWYSPSCHMPSETLLGWTNPYYTSIDTAYATAIKERLRAHYQDRLLVPTCSGSSWAAYGGMMDFRCEWRLPGAWQWNTTYDCRHWPGKQYSALDKLLCHGLV